MDEIKAVEICEPDVQCRRGIIMIQVSYERVQYKGIRGSAGCQSEYDPTLGAFDGSSASVEGKRDAVTTGTTVRHHQATS